MAEAAEQYWLLAHLNVAHLRAPLDSPLLADFVDAAPAVNARAESTRGYVWRLQDSGHNSPFAADYITTLSLWKSLDALREYVYSGSHLAALRRRSEWFHKLRTAYVLWWVAADHRPDLFEAEQRYRQLDQNGASAEAFDFKTTFQPPA